MSAPTVPAWVAKVRAEVGEQAPMVLAADRVEFRLTYAATDPRPVLGCTLDGPELPDAYGDVFDAPGEWFEDGYPTRDDPEDGTVEGWIDHYARMAVGEAVHEALEWFRVDGAPWLDPHGPSEAVIHEAVGRLVAEFVGARASEVAS